MKTITVVGRGLDPAKHLTLDAIRVLKNADIVLGIEPEEYSWTLLREEFDLPEIKNIGFLYKNGAKDLDNYNSFIEYVFETTLHFDNVVLLVAGHPRLGVTFAQLLTSKTSRDHHIRFVEGISSFDVMLNDLAIDPLEKGTSILDVNRLLLFKYELEPSINYFFYHVCSVGTSNVNFIDASKDNSLTMLQEYLERYFESDKVIYLCKASNGQSHQSSYIPVSLSELSRNIQEIDFGTTLFVPAEKPSQVDVNFLQMLRGTV